MCVCVCVILSNANAGTFCATHGTSEPSCFEFFATNFLSISAHLSINLDISSIKRLIFLQLVTKLPNQIHVEVRMTAEYMSQSFGWAIFRV